MSQILIVGNEERGCGVKKTGSCYLLGSMSAEGYLTQPWMLGSHVEGEDKSNFYARVPHRGVHFWNPAASLVLGELITEMQPLASWGTDFEPEDWDIAARVGTRGLIDHVGENNYTPREFVVAAHRQAGLHLTRADLGGGLGHRIDRAECPLGQEPACRRSEKDGQRCHREQQLRLTRNQSLGVRHVRADLDDAHRSAGSGQRIG